MNDNILGWTEAQWAIALEWYTRNGDPAPSFDTMAGYVAVRHEWQKYKGVRLP